MIEQTRFKEAEARLARLQRLESLPVNPYPHRFDRTHTLAEVRAMFNNIDQKGGEVNLRISGRVMAIRNMGRLLFADLADEKDTMQFIASAKLLGEEAFTQLSELLDRGDHLGICVNRIFLTRTGDLALQICSWTFLSKCLLLLPEKYHYSGAQKH